MAEDCTPLFQAAPDGLVLALSGAILALPLLAGISLFSKWRHGHRSNSVAIGMIMAAVWGLMLAADALHVPLYQRYVTGNLRSLISTSLLISIMADWGLAAFKTRPKPAPFDLVVLLLIVAIPILGYFEYSSALPLCLDE